MELLYFLISASILAFSGMAIAFYKQKGENIATKQDIAEITHKIEAVKSKLMVTTQSEIDFKTDQKLAVLAFYDAFVFWYYDVLELLDTNLDGDDMQKIESYPKKIEDAYKKVVITSRRLELYEEDDSLLVIVQRLISTGMKVETATNTFLTKIYFIYSDLNELNKIAQGGIKINIKQLEELEKKDDEEWDAIYNLKEKTDDIIEDLLDQFKDESKKYLKGV